MPKLPNKFVVDLTGGVRNDKSDYRKNSNELVKILNFDMDNSGKLTKRRGSHQFGDTGTGNIENSFYWQQYIPAGLNFRFLVNNTASPSAINQIIGTHLTANVATSDTTINVENTTTVGGADFDTPAGDIEIEGDIIAYSGRTGTTFTGCSGINSAHLSGTAVHQLDAVSGTSVDGQSGVYYAVLNNLVFINGRNGSSTYNATTMTAVGDGDEPNGLFATTYRQRIYLADSGVAGGVPRRIYFSDAGDATSWTSTSFFDLDVEDGEVTQGIKVLNDRLLLFQTNSFFAYDEATLKEKSDIVGAYNHKVIQEIDGLIYTFCPSGIFVTNGESTKRISNPVKDYIKDFRPVYDGTIGSGLFGRVVVNTFAAKYQNKYILYIQDVQSVNDPDTILDVALVYDTEHQNWTVYNGLTNFRHLNGLLSFYYGNKDQHIWGLFGGDSSGKFYRFFTKKFQDVDSVSRFPTGGDIFPDLISDTGVVVSADIQTKLFDFGTASLKTVKYLRVLAESPGFHASFKFEDDRGRVSDWRSLGEVDIRNKRFRIPTSSKGYRFAARVTHTDRNIAPTLNGFVFEGITSLDDDR